MFIPLWVIIIVIIGAIMMTGKAEETENKVSELEDRLDEIDGGFSRENEFNDFE